MGSVLSQTSQRLYCVGSMWEVFCLKRCGGYIALSHCVGVFCFKHHSSYVALGRCVGVFCLKHDSSYIALNHCGGCLVSNITAVILRWIIGGGVLS